MKYKLYDINKKKMNEIKFVRIDVCNGKPTAIFCIEKCANREYMEYSKSSFHKLPMTKEILIVYKWLNEYEYNLRKALS